MSKFSTFSYGASKFSYEVELDLDDVARRVARNMKHEEVIDFIRKIDAYVEDWDFTAMLIKLAGELKEMMKEANIPIPVEEDDSARRAIEAIRAALETVEAK